MQFLIADTFTDILARLTGDEQKAVYATESGLLVNASSRGLSLCKLDKARDQPFTFVPSHTVRVARL